ncbi:MAG: SPFH domain-containing protein [Lachnospiraceae bacterium]|nr:SPFH domain-containing protein [Lachnospiraceae bacterium]
MGLLRAAKDAIGGLMADQWREYFYCESIPSDVLVTKGVKQITPGRNSNTKGADDIITNGSIIAVNEGQCMLIVDQGKIVEFCAEAGEFIYDTSSEPSLFYGKLGENLRQSFSVVGKRFSLGGNTGKNQRVYFVNTKEIMNNLFGTPSPIPFRIVDPNINLAMDIAIRCNGEYSFQIKDPLLFYSSVSGNVTDVYRKNDELSRMMKAELLTALQPAFAKISAMGVLYSAVPAHTMELTNILNEELSEKWAQLRGIEMVSMAINSMKASEEDEKRIKEAQETAIYRSPEMAAAFLARSQGEAMKAAASNQEAGAMMGFAAMNMAQMTGGMNANSLFAMGQQNQNMQGQQAGMQQGVGMFGAGNTGAVGMSGTGAAGAVLGWSCACGKTDNRGRFCQECGNPKPAAAGWTCGCGNVNQGKFCTECGKMKPQGAPLYKCDKCGWEPEDPTNPPKFCPECGDIFDENDIK